MEVASYIGLPFEKFNCAALVVKVSRELLGKEIPLHVSDCPDPMDAIEVGALMAGQIIKQWTKVDEGVDGDVVLFRMQGFPSHVGLVIGGGKFLHVLPGREACIEKLDSVHWRSRVVGFYRFDG
jgi:hypothetical protein